MAKIIIIVHKSKSKSKLKQLEIKMANMQEAVDGLVTKVTGLTTQVGALVTVVDNVVVFEQGQAARIAALEDELKSGGVPTALIDKVLEIGATIQSNADSLNASKDKLVKASVENTAPGGV